MEFKYGTSVVTVDGKHAGNLDRVVIHPELKVVTHVVVQEGILTNEDRVVPMEMVLYASQEQVALSCSSDEFKDMSPLVIKQMEPRGQAERFENLGGGIYTNPSLDPYVVKEIIRTIPDDLVVLKGGARVMSEDSRHVGNIEMVVSEARQVTQFITAQGLLFKTKKAIPVEWVLAMNDDEVKLSVSARQFEELPKE